MKTKTGVAFILILTIALSCLAGEPQLNTSAQIAVNILGAVNKQCRISLSSDATVLDALASAQGVSDSGSLEMIMIIHKINDGKSHITKINVNHILDGSANNVTLLDGDTIDVPGKTFNISY